MQELPFCKLHFTFDEAKLKHDLDICLQEQWKSHLNRDDYNGSWNVIALRSPSGLEIDQGAISPSGSYQFTPLLQKTLYFEEVITSFKSELETVRLLNLRAGSQIHLHDDVSLSYFSGSFRLHIPIQTNPDVDFRIDGQKVKMMPGECWYGNFELPHEVRNDGNTDRIHLVLDMKVDKWTDELFKTSGINLEQLRYQKPKKLELHELRSILENLQHHDNPANADMKKDIEQQIKKIESKGQF